MKSHTFLSNLKPWKKKSTRILPSCKEVVLFRLHHPIFYVSAFSKKDNQNEGNRGRNFAESKSESINQSIDQSINQSIKGSPFGWLLDWRWVNFDLIGLLDSYRPICFYGGGAKVTRHDGIMQSALCFKLGLALCGTTLLVVNRGQGRAMRQIPTFQASWCIPYSRRKWPVIEYARAEPSTQSPTHANLLCVRLIRAFSHLSSFGPWDWPVIPHVALL